MMLPESSPCSNQLPITLGYNVVKDAFMNRLIEERRLELECICKRRKVRRIELFGSAAGAAFDPEHSDLDFLVSFHELRAGEYADTYFGLLEDLQALFGRPVDLVVDAAFTNPYFQHTVNATRTLVYAD